ncbi:hypothetical protein JW926_00560 [Candidatus Sumerlaeota bacterium]|nr:hypothetical protein [Candidatus Sumerlaeota bacterium]
MKKNWHYLAILKSPLMLPLLVLLLLAPIFSQSSESRDYRIVAPYIDDEIAIDGALNERAWKNAGVADNFSFLGEEFVPASPQTSVKILSDGKNLFLGFTCQEPDMKNLKSSEKPRDGDVFHDDSLEVIIDPSNDRTSLFHLIANVNGSEYDTSGTIRGTVVTENKAWNGKWKAAGSKNENAWFSEWKIPLSELGVSIGFPITMGINLCRTRPRDQANCSSWSRCVMRFIEPDRLGELIIPEKSGEYCIADFPQGVVSSINYPLPQVGIRSFYNAQKRFRIAYELQSLEAEKQKGYSADFLVPARGEVKIAILPVPAVKGFYTLHIRLEDIHTGHPAHVITRNFEVRLPLKIMVKPFALYEKRMAADVNIFHPDAGKPGALLSVSLFREKEQSPLETSKRKIAGNGNESFSFSLEGKQEGRYLLKAELRNGENVLSSAESMPLVFTPNPEIGFTEHGFLKVDGKPFFPIGIYTLQSRTPGLSHDDVLREARDAGFNMTVFYAYKVPDLTPLIDAAHRNHIPAFVYGSDPYKIRKGKWTPEEVSIDLDARLDHPALLGWYLVDEPEGIGETNQDTLRRLYETVKAKDMNHPCSLVIMSPHAAKIYGSFSDIVWVDPYPIPDHPVTYVSQHIDGVIEAVKGERPVWAVLQAFDWNIWRKGAIDKAHRPTPEEERCMTYLALIHGAKGIIYWAHTASRYYIRDYPEHWNFMKRLAGELRDLSPVLLSMEKAPVLQVLPDTVPLDTMVKKSGGGLYVFAANRESAPCNANFKIQDGVSSVNMEVLFENRRLKIESGGWKDSFAPLAVHVYKLAP